MSPEVVEATEKLLCSFASRVDALRRAGEDLSALEEPEVSGIAGTGMTAIFGHGVARHLARRHPGQVSIDWDLYDQPERLANVLPHLVPVLKDDTQVEAHVPFEEWTRASAGTEDLAWLVRHIEQMWPREQEQADRYDALRLPVRWEFGDSPVTRTRTRLPAGLAFCHTEPLVRRSDVSLDEVFSAEPLPIRKLEKKEAEELFLLVRSAMAARYRELHGFTYPDAKHVYELDPGRGVKLYFSGVPAEWRLPLRAYHGATMWKNGVQVGYFEGLSLFERMEAGFNLFYTFREGETAWLYAQILRACRQLYGVKCFVIDPYQIGHENEEAIESGAFWFYRKLGFRSVDPRLRELTVREEERIRRTIGYRTGPPTLRKLAERHMIYGAPGADSTAWEGFHVRSLGLATARAMAAHFGGDLIEMRGKTIRWASRILEIPLSRWSEAERQALANWAPVLALIQDLDQWSVNEKNLLAGIIRAKAATEETRYLRLMQQHSRLRQACCEAASA